MDGGTDGRAVGSEIAAAALAVPSATWRRLRCGAWGLAVAAGVVEGDTVTAIRRNGSREWRAVGRVLWTAEDGSATLAHDGGPSVTPAPVVRVAVETIRARVEVAAGEVTDGIPADAIEAAEVTVRRARMARHEVEARRSRGTATAAQRRTTGVRTTAGFQF